MMPMEFEWDANKAISNLRSCSPAKRSASRGKVDAALRVVSPEAALDAPCPG